MVVEINTMFGTIRHSRQGPYTARSASDRTNDWPFWYVAGEDGRYNGMSFDNSMAKFTTREMATEIAAAFNKQAAE